MFHRKQLLATYLHFQAVKLVFVDRDQFVPVPKHLLLQRDVWLQHFLNQRVNLCGGEMEGRGESEREGKREGRGEKGEKKREGEEEKREWGEEGEERKEPGQRESGI